MTRNKKIFIIIIVVVAGFFVWFLNREKIITFEECEKIARQIRIVSPSVRECKTPSTFFGLIEGKAFRKTVILPAGFQLEALRGLVSVANQLSGIQSGATFNFEIVDTDGKSANFGIYESDGVAGGESLVEEHMAIFQEVGSRTVNVAEVDIATNRVISMHRTPVDFGDMKPFLELEKIVRQFLERIDPNFIRIESTLANQLIHQDGPDGGTYFFRWNDKQFALPDGLEMDLTPFIQVGIKDSGFIFSYDNTIQLYSNLSKEALRAICAFVEIPQTDDSSLDSEKGTVKVWFSEYEPFQNKYLVLPYEPETDFEGCSESAKTYLRHLPNPSDKN